MEIKPCTIRKKPYPGETLVSFLLRISQANGINFLSLWNHLKENKNRYAQRNEIHLFEISPVSTLDLERAQEVTGLQEKDILKQSFHYLLSKFYFGENIERSRFISGMIHEDFYYCPKCINKKGFHQLLWRIKGIEGCLTHGVYLQNSCPNCKKIIRYSHVINIDQCPYCNNQLNGVILNGLIVPEQHSRLSWLVDFWNSLMTPTNLKYYPSNVAIRILYLLNQRADIFDKELVKKRIKEPGFLPVLLQYARESLSRNRSLHLSFILQTLYENNIHVNEFLEQSVPQIFVNSIKSAQPLKKDEVSCLAPWCDRFDEKGKLIKTGTSYKEKNNGEALYYYLACLECGCEYAFNKNENLVERTYFIKGYYDLKELISKVYPLRKISRESGYSQDKIKRCFAYFTSRGLVESTYSQYFDANNEHLTKFVHAVKCGAKIKEIQRWVIWESYNHFLFYRYHPEVMKEMNLTHQKKGDGGLDIKTNREKVDALLEKMLEEDIDITISSVSKKVGVCPETLRQWECNPNIAQMKKSQKEKRTLLKKKDIYLKSNAFFEGLDRQITSRELYDFLGIQRTVLWRDGPEITGYLGRRLVEHNKEVKLKVCKH